jgi:hypothetical protein
MQSPQFVAPEARAPNPETPLGECKFYISPEEPECGAPAVAKVRVRNRAITATVDLCEHHKAVHDEIFMRNRKTTR